LFAIFFLFHFIATAPWLFLAGLYGCLLVLGISWLAVGVGLLFYWAAGFVGLLG